MSPLPVRRRVVRAVLGCTPCPDRKAYYCGQDKEEAIAICDEPCPLGLSSDCPPASPVSRAPPAPTGPPMGGVRRLPPFSLVDPHGSRPLPSTARTSPRSNFHSIPSCLVQGQGASPDCCAPLGRRNGSPSSRILLGRRRGLPLALCSRSSRADSTTLSPSTPCPPRPEARSTRWGI